MASQVFLRTREDSTEGPAALRWQGTPAQDRFERGESPGEKPGQAAVSASERDGQDGESLPQVFEPLGCIHGPACQTPVGERLGARDDLLHRSHIPGVSRINEVGLGLREGLGRDASGHADRRLAVGHERFR